MIHYIVGTLVYKTPVLAIVETDMGLAFELNIPISTYETLPEKGNRCRILTHLHITQDDVRLFGFSTEGECELYKQLIRITGVGPKIALSILSTLPIATFVKSVEREETALITKVPGIGLKNAQRLIIELKGKLLHLTEHFETKDIMQEEGSASQVEDALISLGFNAKDIRRELAMLPEEIQKLNTEQLIKEVIKRIYQRSR